MNDLSFGMPHSGLMLTLDGEKYAQTHAIFHRNTLVKDEVA